MEETAKKINIILADSYENCEVKFSYRIPLKAEIADPEFSPVVDLAERVEDGPALVSTA